MVEQVTPQKRVTLPGPPSIAARARASEGREANKSAPPLLPGLCYQLGGGIASLADRRKTHTLQYRPGGALRFGGGKVPLARPARPAGPARPVCPPETHPACGAVAGTLRSLGQGSCADVSTEDAGVGGDGLGPPSSPGTDAGLGAKLLRMLQEGTRAEGDGGDLVQPFQGGVHAETQCETCFMGHMLSPSVAHVAGGTCDRCCRQVARGECFGQCAPCNFWLCNTCDPGMPPASPEPWGCNADSTCVWPMALDGVYIYPMESLDPSRSEGVWQQLNPTAAPYIYVGACPDPNEPTSGDQPGLWSWAPCPGGAWDVASCEQACGAGVCLSGAEGSEAAPMYAGGCDLAADRSEPEGEPSSEEPKWAGEGSLATERTDWDKKLLSEAPVLGEEEQLPSEQQTGWVGWGWKNQEKRGRDTESEPQQPRHKKEKSENYVTVMLRNIPNKYTREMLIGQLNQQYQGQFDFLYLPIDFKHKCNVGYGFVNFRTVEACHRFISQFHGVDVKCCLPGFNSKKVVEVTPARMQGLAENIKRLRNSPVMSQLQNHPEWLPLLFGEGGAAQPFPRPDQVLPPMQRRG